jgi:outer membrane biosynthesis protein TonB
VFRSILARLVLTAALASAVGALVAGCGGGSSTASQQEIAQAERHGRIERAEKEKERQLELKLAKLERENQQAKKRHREKERRELKEQAAHVSQPPSPSSTSTSTSSTPSGTDCGSGVIAGPETSCGFALETRAEYEREIGSGSGSFEAWSEANETWYPMYCTGSPHECSGAISATVYWP